ncbi:MAG: HOG (high osmolarity glycerol) pathway protein [Thelocarpon superellum]|nr:MAG: HOG (high osmolarity glycerol) pathway protein [Thelocarpon superellum]
MTAVLSPPATSPSPSSPIQSPQPAPSGSTNPNHPSLPPLVTSNPRRNNLQRPPPPARDRLSTYSNASNVSQMRSRPPSQAFLNLHSSLSYTAVRDFAYPDVHPMHYGPPPEPSGHASGVSTPASEAHRRLSDPARASWDRTGGGWSVGPWGGEGPMSGESAPQLLYQDGPPWSEDEDLQSPVVVSSRHKKYKSSGTARGLGNGRGTGDGMEDTDEGTQVMRRGGSGAGRAYLSATVPGTGETYYANEGEMAANGPGGEFVAHAPDSSHTSTARPHNSSSRANSAFNTTLPSRSYLDPSGHPYRPEGDSSPTALDEARHNESRYSRDYQFTIASPDEEMHGKAVALFDFTRENENELPLIEGQVIWVSYRHGQGWLVAEDPKTHESGLVPEEYVRLLRDIRGGWGSLTGDAGDGTMSPQSAVTDVSTPTQADHQPPLFSPGSSGSNGFQHPPVVSVFSTSSKDLDPYPQHLLGTQQGQTPPQVVHYHGQRGGSQTNTPTLLSPKESTPASRATTISRTGLADMTNGPESTAATIAEAPASKEAEMTES